MRKKVLIITIVSMLFCGVVSAASLWGNYKGHSVVRVKVDGSVYKPPGVPALLYDGQFMVPSRVLVKAGIPFTYDQKNQTVSFKKLAPPVDPKSVRQNAVNQMQLYFSMANEYKNLNDFGYFLNIQISTLSHSMSNLLANVDDQTTKQSLGYAADGQKQLDDYYKQLDANYRISDTVKRGASNDIDMNPMEIAYEKVGKAKDYLGEAETSLQSFYTSGKNKNDGDNFFDNLDKAYKEYSDAVKMINEQYEKTYQLLQNYK